MAKQLFCNICGKKMNSMDECGSTSIRKPMGYGSKYDGEYIEVDFCPDCFDKIIDGMQIPPFMKD